LFVFINSGMITHSVVLESNFIINHVRLALSNGSRPGRACLLILDSLQRVTVLSMLITSTITGGILYSASGDRGVMLAARVTTMTGQSLKNSAVSPWLLNTSQGLQLNRPATPDNTLCDMLNVESEHQEVWAGPSRRAQQVPPAAAAAKLQSIAGATAAA
jgi:hypothetical protein